MDLSTSNVTEGLTYKSQNCTQTNINSQGRPGKNSQDFVNPLPLLKLMVSHRGLSVVKQPPRTKHRQRNFSLSSKTPELISGQGGEA